MSQDTAGHACPECGEPIAFTFRDTSGVGAHKRGDNFNTTPDTDHFICFSCGTAWKRRLTGPFTPDVVGDLAFFTCRHVECGQRLEMTDKSPGPGGTRLRCARGHEYTVRAMDDGGLTLENA